MLLADLLVVDFTRLLPGPYATLRLSDMGARVIKVEPPGGDPARVIGAKDAPAGIVFLANNRNKESIELDLTQEADVTKAQALIGRADVVIESFRPGVADRLGIGYQQAVRLNPRVVYCSLTGYGQTGLNKQRAGHDLNYMAISGMLSQLVDSSGCPIVPHVQWADHLGAFAAVEAILGALYQLSQTGMGSYLDVNMTDALLGMLTTHALAAQCSHSTHGLTELSGELLCYHIYETRDHRFVSLAALEMKFWANFCEAAHHPEWIFAQMKTVSEDRELYDALCELFATYDMEYWTTFGERVDCCLQPLLSVDEALASDYVRQKQLAFTMKTESYGELSQVWTMAGGANLQVKNELVKEPPQLGKNELGEEF